MTIFCNLKFQHEMTLQPKLGISRLLCRRRILRLAIGLITARTETRTLTRYGSLPPLRIPPIL